MPNPVPAHCYCGAVRFTVDVVAPVFTAYCHCDDCRRSHAAPLYEVAAVPMSAMHFTAGEELVVDFRREGSPVIRSFCGRCGTKIRILFPESQRLADTVGWFVNLADDRASLPDVFRPKRHANRDGCVLELDLVDQLRG